MIGHDDVAGGGHDTTSDPLMDGQTVQTLAAWLLVKEATKGKRGVSGSIECPVPNCGGRVHYSTAPGNGHIRATCSTLKCHVKFME